MTAVSTTQFANQSAGLITNLKDGTLDNADFVNQWAQLLNSWGVSNPALALGVQNLLTSTTILQSQFFNWLGGAATGGAANINGQGQVVLTTPLQTPVGSSFGSSARLGSRPTQEGLARC